MITIHGYQTRQKIYDGSRTRVYRGHCNSDQQPVIIKLLKSEYPTFNELVQFRNQYTITKNLNLPGIVKPIALENYGNTLALIMEDVGGVSLSDYIANSQLSLDEFFPLAIQIVQILEGLSRNRIIHKDIKPQNILINPQTREVKLIDFSISSLLPRENQEILNPNVLEGTLAYMSPEQTGRMNRGIDYRTDFYSLGVTLYELLTGQLPFQSSDPMELVYCHIARMPTPPIKVNPAIPEIVNNIILKLMAKTAEERYQTAFGLRFDLETCWQQWLERGSISHFPLGERDISEQFVIPEKLYGREAEVATLLAAFDRVAGGAGEAEGEWGSGGVGENFSPHAPCPMPHGRSELMLVAGFSGIGKTAVVSEIHKPIVRQRGYFITGKFDQFKRNIPFSAWVQAFQNLVRQLLTESATSVQEWKAKILDALGENGQIIIDVIPELEQIIGKQLPVLEPEPYAAQNRFNLLFQQFIQVFTAKEHPLVIFLDDLQWADSASLKLMRLLISEADTRYLLLIGTYRDNEVSNTHPLMLTLDQIRNSEAIINQITLTPFHQSSLNQLIADTLNCPLERAVPLTELVFQKTKGNPFFSNQFLKALYEERLISFDFNQGYWQCDIAKVRSLSVSDDIVEFMADQLKKLPENTQEVLRLAACIGNSFDLATLSIVFDESLAKTAADLWPALQERLLIPISEIYKFFTTKESEVSNQESAAKIQIPDCCFLSPDSCSYKFLHDRVQQAAYSLIPEAEKQLTHLKIGQLLLTKGGYGGAATTAQERDEKIFDIVNQLNMGAELITRQVEREELAKLNLVAGRKAKASTAYIAAVRYLTVGMKLLTVDSWQQQYELTLALYEEAAEAAFLSGDFEEMERLVKQVLQKTQTLLDKVKIYEIQIQACIAQNKQLEAIKTVLPILQQLGVEFPQQPSQLDIQLGLAETRSNLQGKSIEDLINLPQMTDPYKLAAMQLLSSVWAAAYEGTPELMPLMTFQLINLSLKHGNAPVSAYAYASYGLILCGVVGDIDSGYQFGQLALSVLNRLNAKELKAKIFAVVNAAITHWQEHINLTLKPLQEAYQSGLETGDLEFASHGAYLYCFHSYFTGKQLTMLEPEMAAYSDSLTQLKQETNLNYHQIYRQSVLNLMGRAKNPCHLIGEAYDVETNLAHHQLANDRYAICALSVNQLNLCYLFGEYSQAIENARVAAEYLDGVTGTLLVPFFYFYASLAQLAIYSQISDSQQKLLLSKVAANQEKMKKWADHAPMNYLHKFYLVEAERHRVLGQKVEAIEYYDRAIVLAKENEYINEEALAHELAAKFYLTWGKEKIAQVYLTDAYYAYARWGSSAKVEDLEKRYSQLLAPILKQEKNLKIDETIFLMSPGTLISNSSDSNVLDLATVIKASQAISGEIRLEQLLATLMQVVVENAGASKCVLILQESGKLVIEATATGTSYGTQTTQKLTTQGTQAVKVNTQPVFKILQSIPVETSNQLPISVINYVARTQEYFLSKNLSRETQSFNDPYIIQQQPKSVLCTPIQKQGKLIGILYLENNLATGAFTTDRLKILNLLSTQAAISIENARLYANLEDYNCTLETKVEERTQELSHALTELKATQEELIQSEKMAALGQLIAGVAHEINTPLGAIRSSVENIGYFLAENLEQLPKFLQTIPQDRQLDFFTLLHLTTQKQETFTSKEKRQLKRDIRKQLESKKLEDTDVTANILVDLGVYNIEPFWGLLQDPNSKDILNTIEQLTNLQRSTQTITTATERAAKVVFALKTYARYDSTGEKVQANLIDGIETVLTLYHNQFKHGVKVIRNYGELLPIFCYPDELNQVWTNLVHNALQAMEYKGILKIDARQKDSRVVIRITDSGQGIPKEIIPKIFDPFFTTKPAGEGSGLGLNIVKKIIDKHEGTIKVDSQPGQTIFTVYLPIIP